MARPRRSAYGAKAGARGDPTPRSARVAHSLPLVRAVYETACSPIRGASPLGLPYTRPPPREALRRDLAVALAKAGLRAPLRRRASASAKATARPRRSACGAKAGRSRGSLARLARFLERASGLCDGFYCARNGVLNQSGCDADDVGVGRYCFASRSISAAGASGPSICRSATSSTSSRPLRMP